jgi:hypothetical protein
VLSKHMIGNVGGSGSGIVFRMIGCSGVCINGAHCLLRIGRVRGGVGLKVQRRKSGSIFCAAARVTTPAAELLLLIG